MTPEQVLLAAIVADPCDDLAWLALADWLEESGQEPRAELLRLTRTLLTLPRTDEHRPGLETRQWALLLAGTQPCFPRRTLAHGIEVVLIPPGTFELGSPPEESDRDDNEELQSALMERAFWLGTAPITQGQFRAMLGRNPSYHHTPSEGDPAQFPVESLSWEEALAFAALLDARLPTSSEWEFACRAGTYWPYYCGPGVEIAPTEFHAGNVPHPCAVKRYPPNAFGLYDMLGNVWEMAGTFAPHYLSNQAEVRGGCYQDLGPICRSAKRLQGSDDEDAVSPGKDLGFRIAMDWTS